MTTTPRAEPNGDEFSDVPDFIPEDEFLTTAPKEGTADERAAHAARIAQGNDKLRQAGPKSQTGPASPFIDAPARWFRGSGSEQR